MSILNAARRSIGPGDDGEKSHDGKDPSDGVRRDSEASREKRFGERGVSGIPHGGCARQALEEERHEEIVSGGRATRTIQEREREKE